MSMHNKMLAREYRGPRKLNLRINTCQASAPTISRASPAIFPSLSTDGTS